MVYLAGQSLGEALISCFVTEIVVSYALFQVFVNVWPVRFFFTWFCQWNVFHLIAIFVPRKSLASPKYPRSFYERACVTCVDLECAPARNSKMRGLLDAWKIPQKRQPKHCPSSSMCSSCWKFQLFEKTENITVKSKNIYSHCVENRITRKRFEKNF